MIDSSQLSIRDLSESDIPLVLDYWFRSPPGFIESLGVDFKKMPQEQEMALNLIEKCRTNAKLPVSKLNALIITYQDQPIGMHTLFPLTEGDFGIFHAHIWKPEMRKRGLARYTYPRACLEFMNRFNLKRILFKTPVQNSGAIKVKEKLGIRAIGNEVIGFGIIKDGTVATVYELTRDEAEKLARESYSN
jgi:RimJ/RimL family protein N-acetyltransferase